MDLIKANSHKMYPDKTFDYKSTKVVKKSSNSLINSETNDQSECWVAGFPDRKVFTKSTSTEKMRQNQSYGFVYMGMHFRKIPVSLGRSIFLS